jgi:hypothetical protein
VALDKGCGSKANRRGRPAAVGIVGAGGEDRRHAEAVLLEYGPRCFQRGRMDAEGAGTGAAMERGLIRLRAGIHLGIGARYAEHLDEAGIGKADIAVGDTAGIAARLHLKTKLDCHDRGRLVDRAAPQQNMVQLGTGRRHRRGQSGRAQREYERGKDQRQSHGKSLPTERRADLHGHHANAMTLEVMESRC